MQLLAESSDSRKSKSKARTKEAAMDDEEDDLRDILSARAKRQKRQAMAAAPHAGPSHEVSISDRSTDSSAASVLDDTSKAGNSSTSMEAGPPTVNRPSTTDSMMAIEIIPSKDDGVPQQPVIAAPSNTDAPADLSSTAIDGDLPKGNDTAGHATAEAAIDHSETRVVEEPVAPSSAVAPTKTKKEGDPVVDPVAAAAENREELSELSSVEDEPTIPRRSERGAGKQRGTGKGRRGNAKGTAKGKGKGKRT
jgi:hypothetical protein